MLATHVPASGAGGGIVRYTVGLARALDARPDVEVSVLAEPAARPFFTDLLGDPRRVHVVPAAPTPVRSLAERAGVLPAFHRDVDVVHGTKHLLPRWGRGRRVLTVHDMLPLDRPHEFGTLKRRLLTGPYLASVRQAETVVCVSAATRERLVHHVPSVADRTAVVPLAASPALLSADPVPVPALVGREFAVVVGDPSPRKNLGFLVDLWPEVVRRRPGAVLAVVGPPSWGPTRTGQEHSRLVARGDLAALGFLSDAELRWCYENATVVLCPSLAEGFGLPAAEALALGAPLITSEDPALREVAGPGAVHVPGTDAAGWAEAVVTAFAAPRVPRRAPERVRSWDDVALETLRTVVPTAR
nr:glycosyltransferase family 1 protein [Kineococcus aurantiacus]